MGARYKPYESYQITNVEWICKIPSHWNTASLSKLFAIRAGGDVETSCFSEVNSEEHPYPIYTNANDEKTVYGYTR